MLSPLAQRTEAQRAAPAGRARRVGARPVHGGARAEARRADDRGRGRERSSRAGVERIVGLVLAPHYSSFSIGQYLDRVRCGRGSRSGITGRRRSTAGRPSRRSSSSSPPISQRGWRRCRPTPRCCSPRTRCRSGSSTAGDPYPDELRVDRGGGGRRARRPARPAAGGPSRGSPPVAHPSRGSAPTSCR